MDSARRRRLRSAYGVLASVALNALLVSAVAFQQPTVRTIRDTDDQRAITAVLVALPKTRPVAGQGGRPSSPLSRPAPKIDRKVDGATAPSASRPAPEPAPSQAPDDEADVRAKVGKALRGLNACAKFEVGPQDRQRPPCGKAWDAPSAQIDPVPAEMRAQNLAEKSRPDDAVKLGNRFRQDLQDHGGQGNNAHFGCSIDTGGKVKCSTY